MWNFPTNNLSDSSEVRRALTEMYNNSSEAYRLNLSLGMILRNRSTDEYRYFIPYENDLVFPVNETISNQNDLERVIERLDSTDLGEHVANSRPDSDFEPEMITNLNFYQYNTDFPLGSEVKLPTCIRNSRSIICLDKNREGKIYQDNFCMFRCLDYFENNNVKEDRVRQLSTRWFDYRHITAGKFSGVQLHEMPDFESCFDVAVNIFELDESTEAVCPVFLSTRTDGRKMYLNLYESHVSLVTNFKTYSKKVICDKCKKLFKTRKQLFRHYASCQKVKNLKYVGGYKQRPNNIFEELLAFGIECSEPYMYFAVYDFESMLISKQDNQGVKLKYVQEHRAVSVAVDSNVPGHDTAVFILNEDIDLLLESMVTHLKNIAGVAAKIMRERMKLLSIFHSDTVSRICRRFQHPP